MGNAEALRNLAEEMASAYEERVNSILAIKQGTAHMLADFGKAHKEMADNLRAELARVKPELQAAESDRKAADQAEIKEREDHIEKLLADFGKAHKEMADNLRAELARVKPELQAAESDRKAADQAEIRERKWAISSMLDDFKKEHEGAAAAWRELLAGMKSVGEKVTITGPVKAEAAVEMKPVEEAIVEPAGNAEEEEPEEEIAEKAGIEEEEAVEEGAAEEKIEEDLGGRILDLLEDHTEGLKMTQVADMLGIENWRTLIPIMRELLDDGEIRKEGTLYFVSE